MEFIDIAHSPKNVLIKATLSDNRFDEEIKNSLIELLDEYKIKQKLFDLCFDNKKTTL